MGGKSGPSAPDYRGAAEEQAKASKEVTEQQTWANRPNQVTPFGSQTWGNQLEWDPATQQYLNKWQQTTELNPASQRALDDQFAVQEARSGIAKDMTGRLQEELGDPMDWSSFRPGGEAVDAQDYGNIGDFRDDQEQNLYSRATSRLDPQWGQREDQLRSRLYNMGAKEGDQAYDQEMENFGRDRNDAYNQAMFASIAGGGSEAANQIGMGGQIQGQEQGASAYQTALRQQDIAEALQRRGMSLNEINAAMSGQQVALPSMPSFQGAQRAEGLQALNAAQMQGQSALDTFNAEQAAMQGMMSGVGSLAGGFG
jgi:hypothetical protein